MENYVELALTNEEMKNYFSKGFMDLISWFNLIHNKSDISEEEYDELNLADIEWYMLNPLVAIVHCINDKITIDSWIKEISSKYEISEKETNYIEKLIYSWIKDLKEDQGEEIEFRELIDFPVGVKKKVVLKLID